MELSDAGGPARRDWQLTWPARIRSSDFVSRRKTPLQSRPMAREGGVRGSTETDLD